jgi:hypothetical protein
MTIERCFACVNIPVSFALWIPASMSIKKINKKPLTLWNSSRSMLPVMLAEADEFKLCG